MSNAEKCKWLALNRQVVGSIPTASTISPISEDSSRRRDCAPSVTSLFLTWELKRLLERKRHARGNAALILGKHYRAGVRNVGPVSFREQVAHVQQCFHIHAVVMSHDRLPQMQIEIRFDRSD